MAGEVAVESYLGKGLLLVESGRLAEAIKVYDELLRLDPDNGAAHFFRGNCLLDLGDPSGAVVAYRKAISIKPNSAGAHFNLGNAYRALPDVDSQLACYRKALELNPEFTDAWVAMGAALQESGRFEEAESATRHALVLNPCLPGTHFNLGGLLFERKRYEDAIPSLREAIALQPDYSDAWLALAKACRKAGLFTEARAALMSLLQVAGDDLVTLNNAGGVFRELGELQSALDCYRRVLELRPELPEALNNAAVLLEDMERYDEAQDFLERALAVSPEFSEALTNLGNFYGRQNDAEKAIACFRKALEIDPDASDAARNLAQALYLLGALDSALETSQLAARITPEDPNAHNSVGNILSALGRHDEAWQCYEKALEIDPEHLVAFSNRLFTANYSSRLSPEGDLAEARRYGKLVSRKAQPFGSWKVSRDPIRVLRIGIVSGDLLEHPVAFFCESVLRALIEFPEPKRFEIFAYSNNSQTDWLTARIRGVCSAWRSIHALPDDKVAELIHGDQIDILIDLSGHTGMNRLPVFAWRPAPIQVTWLGYFATTGVNAIDYFIADPWCLPQTHEPFFVEKILRLPSTRLCFTVPDEPVAVSPLPVGANGFVTFGCFNNLSKLSDPVIELWSEILEAVPGSRLMLKARQLGEASVRAALVKRFAACGVSPQQLILETPSTRREYLRAFQNVDIALDPFPYTGGTTTVESLWMGVPVLTLAGKTLLGRQGVGILANVGLNDWIASSRDDYKRRAIALAGDSARLALLRAGLRDRLVHSPLCDATQFATDFGSALRSAWVRWCDDRIEPDAARPFG